MRKSVILFLLTTGFWLPRLGTASTQLTTVQESAKAMSILKSIVPDNPDDFKQLLPEHYAPRDPSFFLSKDDASDYFWIENSLPDLEKEIDQIKKIKHPNRASNADNTPNLTTKERALITKKERDIQPLRRLMAKFNATTHEMATAQGYQLHEGNWYPADTLITREIILRYLEQRQLLDDSKQPESDDIKTLSSGQKHREIKNPTTASRTIALIDTIKEAATVGIALPEFALQGRGGNIEQGINIYRRYLALRKERDTLVSSVRSTYMDWFFTTQKAPPESLYKREANRIQTLGLEKQAIKEAAEMFAQNSKPPLALLWTPETFLEFPAQPRDWGMWESIYRSKHNLN